MFLPTTQEELKKLNWGELDIILVSGDAYIDSPFSGVALIGKSLLTAGYKVGVVAQPDIDSDVDIMRLGVPKLFWGVTAGTTDSMVANYTSLNKKRRSCDFTPGGVNDKRPDRASIVYTNLIKRFDEGKKPVILGGIEASLRRVAHYDMMTDKVRRPILFDSKADYLVYGMGEVTIVKVADAMSRGGDIAGVEGVCYLSKDIPDEHSLLFKKGVKINLLPPFEDISKNDDDSKIKFYNFYKQFHHSASTLAYEVMVQGCAGRYLVHNPPHLMSVPELDKVHSVDFENETHPYYAKQGKVKAEDVTRYSIASHRGCYGECNFCAISVHQGRRVVSRSEKSILEEVQQFLKRPKFKGNISDIGGATANMYGSECKLMQTSSPCDHRRCLYPEPCDKLKGSQRRYVELLSKVKEIQGVKKVFIASGIRCDLAMYDKLYGDKFVHQLAKHHTSGQVKLAPEHVQHGVLNAMGKMAIDSFDEFVAKFLGHSKSLNKEQYVSCYFMAAHPGCTVDDMRDLDRYIKRTLNYTPEQVQIFAPTPSTWSTAMYYTGMHFETGDKIFVTKDAGQKSLQKDILTTTAGDHEYRGSSRNAGGRGRGGGKGDPRKYISGGKPKRGGRG